ncbi:MAG: Gfo/Idh/MocA family oxidoreductase [Alphaproteobacteria bacterium]|nr:Gfo/Idh/MocA family oxidoreductase [Alphaproteobacteria bacterium]MBV9418517.1 Gfo/Idh/MocA family oxidoreductase [Alphaproteobacteria bacterium]MBV9541232.1 Gfo/Idh/MocA family oxidoreductase [Alphaproteobacteria bacterium]
MALRIGILGAAKIAPAAVIKPAKDHPDFVVSAVGARDLDRAKTYAATHGIPHVVKDYEALVTSPEVDVVYNALPPSGHMRWTIAALEAGKHVLCEKPFAMNASHVRRMNDAAAKSGKTLVEAFHYRHHNVMQRAVAIVKSGELGRPVRVDAHFSVPIAYREGELRWTREHGGGALMDLGCYPTHALRSVMLREPSVVSASCELDYDVDVTTKAELDFGGVPATLVTSMKPERFGATLTYQGEHGTMEIVNYLAPQMGCRFTVTIDGKTREEPTAGDPTYVAQLKELGDVLLRGKPQLITAADSLGNMSAIDAIYAKAGVDRVFD